MSVLAAVTVDVHDSDDPGDIHVAAHRLTSHRIHGTFLVPASLFGSSRYGDALRVLPSLGHEIGSHGFHHDWREVEALVYGTTASQLSFLEHARTEYADFYGCAPRVFRSPVWCHVNRRAADELVRLGYEVDSSATPQRLNVFGSRPFDRGWFLSGRSPYFLRADLLEIPNSTVLLPAASPTFRLLRRRLSSWFVRLLFLEARSSPGRVVVLQFDARDLNPDAGPAFSRSLTPGDFVLRREGGFAFKRCVQQSDPPRVAANTDALLRSLSAGPTMTLSEVRQAYLARGNAQGLRGAEA